MAASYEDRREDIRHYQAEQRKKGQELPQIPAVQNRERREACIENFELFCKTYGAIEFNLPWSRCHVQSALKIKIALNCGGWFAWAMPRGGGKTTLCEWAIVWAILSGRSKYAVIVGATDQLAIQRLDAVKSTLEFNKLLREDFPHACIAIAELEGEARKAGGQRYKGEKTKVIWGSDRVVMPWMEHPDNLCSGSVIEVYGLTGALRGLKKSNKDGSTVRPSLIVADDPQTRESAKSVAQTQSRLQTLTGDIGYLCGPGHSISVVCPCTVIYQEDLADQILDRDKHPEWQGERYKMVESFPANMDLWDKYADIRRASLKEDSDGAVATRFYEENRDAMDAGAQVSWPERHWEDELSGIQHAMNLRIRDEAAFYAECQNEPIQQQDDLEMLSVDEICAKVTGNARMIVPAECSVVTAFTDIQGELLYWMIVAWTRSFSGFVLDYGSWPDQKRQYYTLHDSRKKLSNVYPGDESAITTGALTDLGDMICGRDYVTSDNKLLKLSNWCIDNNWPQRRAAVKAFHHQSRYVNITHLTKGCGIPATKAPMSDWSNAVNKGGGPGWCWTQKPGELASVLIDTNYMKKRVHDALKLPLGSRGCLSLYKAEPAQHRMLADHIHAERSIKAEAQGRVVYEFVENPNRDNHFFDCLTGNFVAASMCGISRDSERIPARPKKKRKMEFLK